MVYLLFITVLETIFKFECFTCYQL